tara:strand:- start:1377 stop:2000 length:624 start_codon:yes stop_codon:yes gene_type:complete
MENNLNSGSIEALQPGQTLLVGARQISSGKIQLEFAEKVNSGDRPVNALSLLNASDSRFSSGARRSWTTAEPEDATKTFGVNLSLDSDKWYDTEKGMQMDLNILNPSATLNGIDFRFKLRITEVTSKEANEWESNNIERAAKRAGKDGDYITHNGDYIFSRTDMVLAKPTQVVEHTLLESDSQNTEVPVNQGVKAEEVLETADDFIV